MGELDSLITSATAEPSFSGRVLLTTIFGDALLPRNQEAGVQALGELVQPVGLNDRLIRTSLQRLTKEGLVTAERRGRQSFYKVHPEAISTFERANGRIYAALRDNAPWDGKWTVAILDPAAGSRENRQRAARELRWAGMTATIPGQVFVSPTIPASTVLTVLSPLGVNLVALSRSELLAGSAGEEQSRMDLADPDRRLDALFARHRRSFEGATSYAADLKPESAFVLRTLLIDSWRRIALAAPRVPQELWPVGWPFGDLFELTSEIHHATFAASEAHLDSIIGSPSQRPRSMFAH